MKTYTPTIGIEVHAELKTKTKMFCNSHNDPHAGEPNVHVCPVCLAHPGTLPVINKEAVRHVLTVGAAVNGTLATYTEFDRKNYFYPDIPKGYQISQYQHPLVCGGELAGVALTRIHLEEDTARSLHDQGEGSIVDYNRAGVPLMELVTEPVIHDAETAGAFARELQLLLKSLGVSDANMEKGEMRVEANISVSDTDELGTKVEVKNLNSFKSVEQAIIYEVKRQAELLERGEVVAQETRGWDENKGKTFSQRSKETAHDYRYFPDPDLPKLDLSLIKEFSLSRIAEKLALTPEKRRLKYENLGLPRQRADVLFTNFEMLHFFDELCEMTTDVDELSLALNYLLTDVGPLVDSDASVTLKTAHPNEFLALMRMLIKNEVTSRVAKDLLKEVLFEGADPAELASDRGLLQQNSEDSLQMVADEVISENQGVVAEYKAGKETSIQYLIGQGMKKTKGAANPETLRKLLEKALNE